jgi:hypothetical protein
VKLVSLGYDIIRILRIFHTVDMCMRVTLPSKHVGRLNDKKSYSCAKGYFFCICCDRTHHDATIKES